MSDICLISINGCDLPVESVTYDLGREKDRTAYAITDGMFTVTIPFQLTHDQLDYFNKIWNKSYFQKVLNNWWINNQRRDS